MSDSGGSSAGVFVGAGIGGAVLIVVVIAVVIYCYLKARKEKSNTNMTKSTDVFHTGIISFEPGRKKMFLTTCRGLSARLW